MCFAISDGPCPDIETQKLYGDQWTAEETRSPIHVQLSVGDGPSVGDVLAVGDGVINEKDDVSVRVFCVFN